MPPSESIPVFYFPSKESYQLRPPQLLHLWRHSSLASEQLRDLSVSPSAFFMHFLYDNWQPALQLSDAKAFPKFMPSTAAITSVEHTLIVFLMALLLFVLFSYSTNSNKLLSDNLHKLEESGQLSLRVRQKNWQIQKVVRVSCVTNHLKPSN